MTTNTLPTWQEKPFEPEETIVFCDEQYTVVKNFGRSGVVRDADGDTYEMAWRFGGEDCKRVEVQ